MNAQFGVIVERDRDLRIVCPIGELDISTVGELATVVERECSSQADLVVDLRGLSFLDCAGLRILLYARGSRTANGSSLRLIPGPARCSASLIWPGSTTTSASSPQLHSTALGASSGALMDRRRPAPRTRRSPCGIIGRDDWVSDPRV